MKTPLELVQSLLSNPTNIEHVRGLTTEDVTYVSLNFDNPELRKVLPWAGTNRGPQSIVDVFNGKRMARRWRRSSYPQARRSTSHRTRFLGSCAADGLPHCR